jgi:VPDSG-CTERM motif
MKKFNKTGPMTLRRVIGNLLTQRRFITILAVAAGLLPSTGAYGTAIDFTPLNPPAAGPGYGGTASFAAGTTVGGSGAIYTTIDTKPAGTGVFDPFLTYQAKGVEEGFNYGSKTDTLQNGQGFLDTKRVPQWTHDLHVGDLKVVTLDGSKDTFYAFELDANETGNGNVNRLLSIDDIRIYTSHSDTASSVGDNADLVDNLGTLRYAQNATLGVTANWVLIDASRKEGGSTSGSGSSDMILYVPTSLFPTTGADPVSPADFLYFYTINGIHDPANDGPGGSVNGAQSNAGFEEWRAATGFVPDGGSTLLLLGSAITALGFLAGRRGLADHA